MFEYLANEFNNYSNVIEMLQKLKISLMIHMNLFLDEYLINDFKV